MNEPQNPFEAALQQTGGVADPFEEAIFTPAAVPAATPTFVNPAQPQALNLGSEVAAPNPFGSPEPHAAQPVSDVQAHVPVPTSAPLARPVAATAAPVAAPAAAPAQVVQLMPDATNGEAGQAPALFGITPQPPAQPPTDSGELFNPIEAAIGQNEVEAQESIFAKRPIFEHGSVKEDIEDLSQTFEDLRVAKADDFPELEDANRVSWEVSYGKIRKMVYGADAKKNKIGEFKVSIEMSREFIDALKKSKDKNPICTIKPKVTAQSKGERMPTYKGVFTSLDDAETSGKTICIVPGSDGKVYEIRNEEAGTFIVPTNRCKELSEIKAGFSPALPLIPRFQLMQIITFFRSLLFTDAGGSFEAIANIVWDKECQEFLTCVPKQVVSAIQADSDLISDDILNSDRFLHYMDVHSHNLMPAKFSKRDDRDEKATRLYAVIGRLDRFMPEISIRMGCGGRHLSVNPNDVFEPFYEEYPEEWSSQLCFTGTVLDLSYDFLPGDDLLDEPDCTGDSRIPWLREKGIYGEVA